MMEEITVYFDVYNGLPFDVTGQAFVTDGNYVPIKQLFDDGGTTILSGIPNANGKVEEATHSELIVHLDHNDIETFRNRNAMYIIVYTEGLTYNNGNQFVKVFTSNSMNINVYTNLNITLN